MCDLRFRVMPPAHRPEGRPIWTYDNLTPGSQVAASVRWSVEGEEATPVEVILHIWLGSKQRRVSIDPAKVEVVHMVYQVGVVGDVNQLIDAVSTRQR